MYATDDSRRRGFAAVPDQVPLVEWDAELGVIRIVPVDLDHAAKARALGGYVIDTRPIVKRLPGHWARRWARLLNLLGLDRGLSPAS